MLVLACRFHRGAKEAQLGNKHRVLATLGEPVGDCQASGASANNDVVVRGERVVGPLEQRGVDDGASSGTKGAGGAEQAAGSD